jgi:putative transposase
MIIELIEEAVASGARRSEACRTIGLAATTVARWRMSPDAEDARRGPITVPGNALSDAEKREVIALMNAPEHSSMSPDTLVPYLATMGIYVASQATFYRILRKEKLLRRRGRARRPSHRRPGEHVATRPNQVWAWDITYLPTTVRGRFLKLYVVLDVWSRLIVGAEVHEIEDDAIAAQMIERCCMEQGVKPNELVLHSDNGGAMKGNTMLAKLQQLGVMPSFRSDSSRSSLDTLRLRPWHWPRGRAGGRRLLVCYATLLVVPSRGSKFGGILGSSTASQTSPAGPAATRASDAPRNSPRSILSPNV